MICKGTVINQVICLCCRNLEGQKKVVDTYFEGQDVIIVFKCLACQGFTKVNFKPYLHRPFNGKGFKVSVPREINSIEELETCFKGLFESVGDQDSFKF